MLVYVRTVCSQTVSGLLIAILLGWVTSVAKWLAHLPFTSKVAGSNLNENFSM